MLLQLVMICKLQKKIVVEAQQSSDSAWTTAFTNTTTKKSGSVTTKLFSVQENTRTMDPQVLYEFFETIKLISTPVRFPFFISFFSAFHMVWNSNCILKKIQVELPTFLIGRSFFPYF